MTNMLYGFASEPSDNLKRILKYLSDNWGNQWIEKPDLQRCYDFDEDVKIAGISFDEFVAWLETPKVIELLNAQIKRYKPYHISGEIRSLMSVYFESYYQEKVVNADYFHVQRVADMRRVRFLRKKHGIEPKGVNNGKDTAMP